MSGGWCSNSSIDKRRDGLLTDDVAAPPDFRDRFRTMYGDDGKTDSELRGIFRQTLSDLRYSELVTVEPLPAGQELVRIRPDGIRELGRLEPSVTYEELGRLGKILLEQDAELQETIEEAKAEQEKLERRIAAFDATIRDLQHQVDNKISDVDARLAHAQRDLYNQVVILMSVFVAAFALILTGAQVAQTAVRGAATIWWQIGLDAAAVMVPIATIVGILVWVSWLLTRPR